MYYSAYLVGLVVTVALPLAGCSEPPASLGPPTTPPLEQDEDEAEGECEPETEGECECPDGTESLRYCYADAAWGKCDCGDDDAPVEQAYFSDCKPGRYEGEFFGMYNSAFSPFPIPVWAFNFQGMPGLAFTLNATGAAPEPGQEFGGELEISDGYVKGTADGLFPFEGKLTGKLNCTTKVFTATLDGGYAVLFEGLGGINEAKFSGPVLGNYDVKTKSFPCQKGNGKFPKCELDAPVLATNAVTDVVAGNPFPNKDNPSYWDLTETDISLPIFPSSIPEGHGGMGYWWAVWKGEGSVDPNTGKPKP
jgi:hypothetical protein